MHGIKWQKCIFSIENGGMDSILNKILQTDYMVVNKISNLMVNKIS